MASAYATIPSAWLCCLVIFAIAASSLTVAAQQAVPPLEGRVVDGADLLTPATEAALTERLTAHETETTQQVAVLTVPSLGGETVEAFGLRVAETWALGTAEADNGVLLLIARDERALRIEVGYGLEGQLTDVQAGRIIRHTIAPHFRSGDYDAGVLAGTEALLATLSGTPLAEQAEVPASELLASPVEDVVVTVLMYAIWVGLCVFAMVLWFIMLAAFPRVAQWVLGVPSIAVYAWAGAALPESTAGRVVGGVLFAGVYLVLLAALLSDRKGLRQRFKRWGSSMGTSSGSTTSTAWTPSRSTSSSWSSGSSSSFSGGGGSFGGGGASGGW